MNGELVQDVDLARHADLRYRLRKGPIGFESLSYPIRFRNLRIKELAAKEQWETLYASEGDLAANWEVSEGKPKFEALGGVLRGDGVGKGGITRVLCRVRGWFCLGFGVEF